jgi:hypothetical protein
MTDGTTATRRTSAEVLREDRFGRPRRLDVPGALRYVALLRAGGYHEPSARTVGYHPDTLKAWRRRGETIMRNGELPAWERVPVRRAPLGALDALTRQELQNILRVLACITNAVEDPELFLVGLAWACIEAEGESESAAVLIWRKHMNERPDMAPRFLERRYPERWGAPKPSMSAQVSAGPGGASASFVVYVPAEVEP